MEREDGEGGEGEGDEGGIIHFVWMFFKGRGKCFEGILRGKT